jgi:RNA polymerase sigma-70 factor (ECF subfamily)
MTTPPAATEEDDGRLVARSLDGDQQAFALLVKRHERLVFRIVGGFLRDRAEVEEVAQDAFLRAFAGLRTFRPGAPFGPWIAQIATRVSYDRLRERMRRPEVRWEDLPPGERDAALGLAAGRGADQQVAARDLAERALAGLPVKDRQALILSDALGLSTQEVARLMGTTGLAIRVRLHRARRAMRRLADGLLREAEPKG